MGGCCLPRKRGHFWGVPPEIGATSGGGPPKEWKTHPNWWDAHPKEWHFHTFRGSPLLGVPSTEGPG